MNMKRIIFSITLLSVMLLSFSGCGEKTPQATESSAPETTVIPAPETTLAPETTPTLETTPNYSSPVNVEGIEIYENVYEHINDSFSYNNRTHGAFYGDVELDDPSYPKERVFLIKSQKDFDQIFSQEIDNTPVDYQSEMYVLYTFTTVYHREFMVGSALVVDQELNIQFRLKSPNEPVGDAARPFQRFVLIKIDKIDINDASFIDIE